MTRPPQQAGRRRTVRDYPNGTKHTRRAALSLSLSSRSRLLLPNVYSRRSVVPRERRLVTAGSPSVISRVDISDSRYPFTNLCRRRASFPRSGARGCDIARVRDRRVHLGDSASAVFCTEEEVRRDRQDLADSFERTFGRSNKLYSRDELSVDSMIAISTGGCDNTMRLRVNA